MQNLGSKLGAMRISWQYLALICLSLISLAVWGRALFRTLSLALNNDQYTHILLILPISVALAVLQRGSVPQPIRPSFLAGAGLLLLAATMSALGRWEFAASSPDIALSLSMAAIVTWWIATVIACLGIQTFRAALFPLLFLFWLVPLPGVLVDRIVELLQKTSAVTTSWFFALSGVPVNLNGVVLSIPGVDLEVARECSSIRSSQMLMVASLVLAHLFLCSTWRKALVVLVAVPISVAKNALRIFTLSMLATRVDPSFLTGRLHHQGGIVFFLLALGAVCALVWVLRRGEAVPSAHRDLATPARAAALH